MTLIKCYRVLNQLVRLIKQGNLYITQVLNEMPNGYARISYELKTTNKKSALNAFYREKKKL